MSLCHKDQAYRENARVWLAEHAPAYSGAARRGLKLQDDLALGRRWMALKAAHNYSGITIPVTYGGAGGTEIEKIIFSEEELRYDTPRTYFSVSVGMPVPVLLHYAREEDKRRFIPPALRGEEIWCQLFSEPAAGSDLAALRLSAKRDGNGWRLSGQKLWTTWAQLSDYGVIITRSDPEVAKHKGLTYFFLDMRSAGIEVRPIRKLNGGEEINEVFFNDVFVPDTQRLGAVNEGFGVAIHTLMVERYSVSDASGFGPTLHDFVGLAQSATSAGRPAIEDGRVRQAIADAAVEEAGLDSIHQRALSAISNGKQPGPEGSIRKLVLGRKRQQMSALALDLMGPTGVLASPVATIRDEFQASWLDAPSLRIAGGTDEILSNTIAERVLGLPQDHRPDKSAPFNRQP